MATKARGSGVSLVYDDFKPTSEWQQDALSHKLIVYLPGFLKEQLSVSTEGRNIIRVRGERLISGNKWSRFLEDFKIPENTEMNLVRAMFQEGILTITIPKKMPDEPHEKEAITKTSFDEPHDKETITKTSFSKEDITVDPESGSSSLCSGCRLPIFSTPSISIFDGGEQLFLHDQCTRLPENLVHELHPDHTLALLNQPPNSTVDCHNCKQICGTLLYQCVDPNCDFRLDLLCASQIRIVHRSHHHSMLAIRQRELSSLTCGACDTKHESESETETETATISYLCNLCSFWIHPDCASLPNAILHYEVHEHSLFLTYNIIPSAADYSKCVICEGVPKRSSGVYFCLKCPNYVLEKNILSAQLTKFIWQCSIYFVWK